MKNLTFFIKKYIMRLMLIVLVAITSILIFKNNNNKVENKIDITAYVKEKRALYKIDQKHFYDCERRSGLKCFTDFKYNTFLGNYMALLTGFFKNNVTNEDKADLEKSIKNLSFLFKKEKEEINKIILQNKDKEQYFNDIIQDHNNKLQMMINFGNNPDLFYQNRMDS